MNCELKGGAFWGDGWERLPTKWLFFKDWEGKETMGEF